MRINASDDACDPVKGRLKLVTEPAERDLYAIYESDQ